MGMASTQAGVANPLEWLDRARYDSVLLIVSVMILFFGLIMVASTSISIADRAGVGAFYYLNRQLIFALVGVGLAVAISRVPIAYWQLISTPLFLCCFLLLALVLVPGLGKTVNGSTRWLPLGVINFQVSELTKFAAILYVAGYLLRHREAVQNTAAGFLKPMLLMVVAAVFLLAEPDFGAAVVLLTVALSMMFLGGARLWQFALLVVLAAGSFAILAYSSPYRMQRITSFLDPFADPFNSGFQLTQALIAIGSGGLFGRGFGESIQKLFYLPEAHTDFLFSVISEELGVFGAMLTVMLFVVLVWRCFSIGAAALRSGQCFGGYAAYGFGLWIGMQAFINMGVNMGLLPTKGLTLPLMSYGGSSLIVMCMALGLLMRIDHETRIAEAAD